MGTLKFLRQCLEYNVWRGCHRSQWPRGLRRGSVTARLLGLRARIPLEAWMSVSCEFYVLSGRGLCVGLITRPEESYRVSECDHESSITRRPWPTRAIAPW